ncbi:MAG: hypothetical protein DWQ31_01885 [Planctomycetota bacterium]|nr:MAG: hypothetical protein DWQ31_01885 [Planctomycetota bacterium]REJ92783.1 MAG: hypothetical protein DWQ35_11460 [Planctomycetota bacterium]
MNKAATLSATPSRLLGRTFVHPLFDYLFIGGGLSLVVTAWVFAAGTPFIIDQAFFAYFLLFSNSAHFAASTVRLYTKRGSFEALPFITMAFPLVCLVVLAVCMIYPELLGENLLRLYLTWSPYHYAAQAYGLAVMYSYRSGCILSAPDKRMLWWVSMLPFLTVFLAARDHGLHWLLELGNLSLPLWVDTLLVETLGGSLRLLSFIAPPLLYTLVATNKSGPMPLISILAVATNVIWFAVLNTTEAFFWATVFHGIQYLAIVIIFHVRDRMSEPDNRHGIFYHVVWFYGACLILGYALFNCLPLGYNLAGFPPVESVWIVLAAINVHHFIVDGYIWRLKQGDSNRKVVEQGTTTAAGATAPT